jgi:hypothetical protein
MVPQMVIVLPGSPTSSHLSWTKGYNEIEVLWQCNNAVFTETYSATAMKALSSNIFARFLHKPYVYHEDTTLTCGTFHKPLPPYSFLPFLLEPSLSALLFLLAESCVEEGSLSGVAQCARSAYTRASLKEV